MSAGDRLRTLEQHVGRKEKPRKRVKRSYDTAAPIALSYSAEHYARSVPAPQAAASFEVTAPRDDWLRPPTLESARPARLTCPPAQMWSAVETPPAPASPLSLPQPKPHFTESDDEAAASSFAADLAGLAPSAGESALPEAADAADFLSRASAVAPRPQAQQAQAEGALGEDGADEDEEPERWRHGHDVFDRMTSYANQFDLGPVAVDLSRAFDAFDRTLQAQVGAPQAPAPAAVERDLASDIDLIKNEIAQSTHQATPDQSFSVVFDVPLVPQQTGYSCWAAGAAMLVAWRDDMSVDPSAIAAATGYWQQYKEGLQAQDTTMFKAWGLVPEPAQTYTVERFRNLIERFGPLWVASAEPGPHIRVVGGIEGDGSPGGTRLHILDPWEPGMNEFRLPNAGGSYTETYEQFEAKQAALARTESNVQGVYVAHIAQERSR
jgi:Papain-like cysteine protease AvrRpt2